MTKSELLNYRPLVFVKGDVPTGDFIIVGYNVGIFGLNWVLVYDRTRERYAVFAHRNLPKGVTLLSPDEYK